MTKRKAAPLRRTSFVPALETLEDRRVMAAPGVLSLGLSAPQVVTGDFDGDGRADVARMSATGIWRVGLSAGTSFDAAIWDRWGSRDGWHSVKVGDFNGDRKDDLAGLARNGKWRVALSNNDHFTSGTWSLGVATTSWASVQVGDFNGDGKDDLAAFSKAGTWIVGLSTGVGFDTSRWTTWNLASRWASIQVGDFNGDQRDDVAGFTKTGSWSIGLSTKTAFTLRIAATWNRSSRWTNLFVGDFNGDGRDDLAGVAKTGVSVVSQSNGSYPTSPVHWANWGPASRWLDWQSGDFNGDGKDDLAAMTVLGVWSVGASSGLSFTPKALDRWRTAPKFANVVAGDFNGDGKDDLAGFFRTSGQWLVARSSGADLHSKTFGSWPLGVDRGPYFGERLPFTADAPWIPSNARGFVKALSYNQLRRLYFNSSNTYTSFVENYKDVLRSWISEADAAGVRTEAQLKTFLTRKLDEHFLAVRPLLAAQHPGLTDRDYRLLMAMNLAHGHLVYATAHSDGRSIWKTVRLALGDCSEIADLCAALARLQGLDARLLGASMNFNSSQGPFVSGHQLVYVPGLWLLDAEINLAFRVDLNRLSNVASPYRLQSLFDSRSVFGFYNWYLKPDVRQEQLSRSLDGGIIAFYYQYYLEAIARDNSNFYFMRR